MISVIIPYYCKSNPVQTEQLLHRAIISASKELRECDSYEIIVVDDGSEFPPRNIQFEFDSNLPIKFFNIPHGCLGAARNYGVERSRGDYLLFLDADDYYFPGTLSICIEKAKKANVELLMYGMKQVSGNSIQTIKRKRISFSNAISGNEFMATHNLPGSSCSFIIKKAFLSREGLKFRENSFLEDEDFTPRLLHCCQSIIFTYFPVYAYYTREGSIVDTLNKEATKRIDIATEVIARLLEYKNNHIEEPHNGLDRKINTLTLDCIRLSLRDEKWRETLQHSISCLEKIGTYPLANSNFSIRYSLYRLLLRTEFGIKILHHIEKIKL